MNYRFSHVSPNVLMFCMALTLIFPVRSLAGESKQAEERTASEPVRVSQDSSHIEADNGRIKIRLTPSPAGVDQAFLRRGNEWIKVAETLRPGEAYPAEAHPLYDWSRKPKYRLMVPSMVDSFQVKKYDDDEAVIELRGKRDGNKVTETIRLARGSDYVHVEVAAELAKPKVEYVLLPLVFQSASTPQFVHTPTLKHVPEDIIGDRVFYSPAIIVQHDNMFAAMVPDLDMINEHQVISPNARRGSTGKAFAIPFDRSKFTMPTGLDLQLQSGLTSKPVMAYGLIDAKAKHHLHWRHPNDGSMVRRLADTHLRFGFDLFLSADARPYLGYQRISRYMWDRYGKQYLHRPRPQAMPFDDYAQVCFPACFAYQGSTMASRDGRRVFEHRAPDGEDLPSWLQWEIDGRPVGGFRNNVPFFYDMLGNTVWWNNVHDAVGMYWWGKRLGDDDLIDKARRAVNLALAAPQHNGMFPSVYRYRSHQWLGSHWDPPMQCDPSLKKQYLRNDPHLNSYQTASMSKTVAHLLRYDRLCEKNERILPYARRYGDFLVENIDPSGCVPAFFSRDLKPNPHLRFNGEGGVHVWCLAELYRATQDKRYLKAAEQIANFLLKEIIPSQRWLDFECYFSCGLKPLNFYDRFQGMEPRGVLSQYWACEGLAALYGVTDNRKYLDAGEQVIDYATLYQTVWHPHYILTAYTFGGWDTDNGDCAWLNAHQGESVHPLVWYGKTLGRQDLLERGIAAARASLVLINHPRHVKNDIYCYPNFPLGLGPENIDHRGFSQAFIRTCAGWGEVSSLSGVANAMRQLGSLYLDVLQGVAVGVDGINVSSWQLKNRVLRIDIETPMAKLLMPYEKAYEINLRVRGLPDGHYSLVINDAPAKIFSATALANCRLTLSPDGRVSIAP